jgi:uncharacterized coiled-coil DUF342 family protein
MVENSSPGPADPHRSGAPDPSLATNERLADAMKQVRAEYVAIRAEARGWVDTLQLLLESKIKSAEDVCHALDRVMQTRHNNAESTLRGAITALEEKIKSAEDKTTSLDRVVQTRLAGSETALNAAMAASDKVVAKIETGVGSVMNEMKANFSKQLDSLKDNIDELKKRIFESGGRAEGSGHMIAIIFAGLAAAAAVVSALVVVFRTPA